MKNSFSLKKIGFGGAALSSTGGGYGFGAIKDEIDLIHMAVDYGIEVFDMAPIYGFNQAEVTLGQAMKNCREKIKIVSKSGVTWHPNKRVDMSNDPKVTRKMLEQSLANLNTDYIDIYMIHWPDPKVDIRFPLEVLAKAQIEGKVNSVGLCNTNIEDYLIGVEVVDIEYLQGEFNLFSKSFMGGIEEEISLVDKNIRTMGWGTFDKGILAGTVQRDRVFPKEDARSWAPWWKKSNWKEKADFVTKIQKKYEVSIRQVALQFSCDKVDFSLCGFKSIQQLEQLQSDLEKKVPVDVMKEVINEFRTYV